MQQNVPFSSSQTIEKARKDIEKENIELEDIQKNTPLLNRYDTPQPRNHERKTENAHLNKSAYCLDNFLQQEISFLRKELDNKQKVIDNLMNLLNGVTTKRDETNFSCKSLQIKNTSEKASHINETISSNRFSIAQNKSQLNVAKEQLIATPSNTSTKQIFENFQNCKTVSDNINNKCKEKSNSSPETQQQEQGQINKAKFDHQLKEIRQQYHSAFNATKQQLVKSDKGTKNISLKNEIHHKWSKNTTLIVGDSIASGIEENRISRQWRKVKVKSFPGATIEDMYDYIKPLLKKCPKNIILHIGTNNTVNDTSRIVLDKLLSLKAFVEKALPDCNVCISNLTLRTDNAKASLTVNNVNQHLSTLQLEIIDNSNISNAGLSRGGLHLNSQGLGKLAINFIKKIKSFKRS